MFLCIFGASLHAVRGFTTWFPRGPIASGGLDIFGQTYEYPLSGEAAASKAPRVIIESFRGNARITGGDVTAVQVKGRKTVRSIDQAGADRANEQTPLEVTGSGDQITIRANQERASTGQRLSVDLEVTVPRGATIEAHGRSGDFDIYDLSGGVSVTGDNTSVRLENIGGEVRLDLRGADIIRAMNVKGAVELKGRGGDIDLQNVEGQVTIDGAFSGFSQFRNLSKSLRVIGEFSEFSVQALPGEVRRTLGDLSASNMVGPVRMTSTRSWDVQLSGFTNSLEVDVAGGDIDLRPSTPLAKIDVRTRTGNIELGLPAGARFDLTASSNRGEVVNDFGEPLTLESGRRGGTLRGSNGGPVVNLQTERGQVLVRRALANEAPPAPTPTPTPPAAPKPNQPLERIEQ
jgi:DUF4097 and DUF4098 domain-containing protein YvlB